MAGDKIIRSLPRRQFVKDIGSLTIGFSLFPSFLRATDHLIFAPELPGSLRRYPNIDAWLQILADNRVRVFTGKIELGQGIGIVIKQVAAEELNCHLDSVEVVHADTGLTPNEGYTAGSGSVKGSAMAVRYAAAAAKQRLIELASQGSKIPATDLYLENGIIKDTRGGLVTSISKLLAGKKWNAKITLPLSLKPKDQYRYVGKAIAGNQLLPTITGKEYFINDLKFPGMLHARIIKPPSYVAYLQTFDRQMMTTLLPQGVDLFINGNLIGVVGDQEYTVIKAAEALEGHLEWKVENLAVSGEDLKDYIVSTSVNTEEVIKTGDIDRDGLKTFSGTFFKPYIMHGSMAPACGIAYFQQGKLQVWTHSQGVYPLRSALAGLTGLSEDDIQVIGVPGAGCFGHNSSDDAAAEAVVIAMTRPEVPIRVHWSRKDEHQWEALGSAMRMQIEAGVSNKGEIKFWQADIWTDTHSLRPNSDAATLLPARYLENPFSLQGRGYLGGGYRNAEPYYKIPSKDIKAHFFEGPLRVSSLRSLGAYANIFAIESIMDEMAYHLSMHPIDFRIKNLDDERAIAVLQKLKEVTARLEIEPNEGLGYSFSRYKNNDGYCAVGVHLKTTDSLQVKLIKMWGVADVGEIMNTDGLKKQIEGGMLQAASWTLMEEVKFNQQHILSQDWIRYPVLRIRDTPEIQVELIDRPEELALGGGELAVPPVPAAITNAIFQATAQRIYDLPIKRKK